MSSSTSSKLFAMASGVVLSVAWLSAIGMGFKVDTKPAVRTIELPTVVIIGHKTAALNATTLSGTVATRKH